MSEMLNIRNLRNKSNGCVIEAFKKFVVLKKWHVNPSEPGALPAERERKYCFISSSVILLINIAYPHLKFFVN